MMEHPLFHHFLTTQMTMPFWAQGVTSFSNDTSYRNGNFSVQVHISLHHSQTSHSFVHTCEHLNTIYLYIILKLMRRSQDSAFVFKCHISLYHPQTVQVGSSTSASLNTIYPYIILKPRKQLPSQLFSLNTIYLYIILKHTCTHRSQPRGLNTIYLYIILKRSNGGWADCGVLIPYIFTSFSNM